jgi:hypothetical protein
MLKIKSIVLPIGNSSHDLKQGIEDQKRKEKKMKSKLMTIVLVIFFCLGISACGSYYMVKDPSTGNTYYTEKVNKEKGGAVKFKDANTGGDVTIQNSEVTEIPKEEYNKNTEKK